MKEKPKELFTRREFLKRMAKVSAGIAITVSFPKLAKGEELELERLSDQRTVRVTDSLNREVTLPRTITRIVPTGMYAQDLLIMLCPEKLAALAKQISSEDLEFYTASGLDYLTGLPTTGTLTSLGTEDLDLDLLAAMDIDAVVDVGYPRDDLEYALDEIQIETDDSTIMFESFVGDLPQVLMDLGSVVNCYDRAYDLADFLQNIYSEILYDREYVTDQMRILFIDENEHGHLPNHQIQNDVIRMIGGTPVEIEYDSLYPETLRIAIETADPDFIVFSNWDYYDSQVIGTDSIWNNIRAIQNGMFAVAPGIIHSWFGSPVLVQILGALWLAQMIWPGVYEIDLGMIAQEFYRLFYHYSLSDDELTAFGIRITDNTNTIENESLEEMEAISWN